MAASRRTNSPRTKPTAKSAKSANADKPVVGETDVDSKAPAEDPTENPEVVVDRTVGDVGEPGTEEPEEGESGASVDADKESPAKAPKSPETAENDAEGGKREAVVVSAAFSFVGSDGFTVTAYKGETVQVEQDAYARGKALGAFA